MSVSTDAILCFGVELDDGFVSDVLGDEDIYNLEYMLDAKFDMSQLRLVVHCHSDEPMYIVAIKKTVTEAYRGSPKRLDLNTMQDFVSPEGLEALKQFDGIMDPSWILCSYWNG